VSDLVTWLRAQLDEDERVARAVAGSGRWVKYSEGGDGAAIETEPGGDPGAIIGDDAMATHIARHNPARVLAEVEAKRSILEMHEEGDKHGDCAICFAVWPCGTLKALAWPYADRPGYDEAWRP
jgi:hypothetical protein